MRSETSFFNRALFLKNITRFWPVWTLYLVVLFFSMPLNLYLKILNASVPGDGGYRLNCMLQCIQLNIKPVFVFFFAILSALAVFSYLYSARNCNMIHAFPVRREELFCTGYVSGLLFLAVPQVITFLLTLLVCIFHNVTSVEYLFYWLLYVLGMSVFFYSMAVFFCMLTGNHFAAVVYYGLGNLVYLILKVLILSFVEMLNYGLTYSISDPGWDMFLSPVVYLSENVNLGWQSSSDMGVYEISGISLAGGRVVAAYLAAAVILIALSLLIYRRRQLECAGDILSLNWMKPIFRWLAAFGFGSGFALLFSAVFFSDRPGGAAVLKICSVAFSFVFFFVAEMFIRKKFRVFEKKRWIESILCAAAIFFILTAIDSDWSGAERYVPREEQIETVYVSNGDYDMVINDPEKIAQMIRLHQTILDHREEFERYSEGENGDIIVTIKYYFGSGRSVERMYEIPVSEQYVEDADSVAGILESVGSAEDYLAYLLCPNYEDIRFTGGYYYLPGENGDETRNLTEQQAVALFAAVKQDIEEGNYPYGIRSVYADSSNTYYNSFYLEGLVPGEMQSIYDQLPQGETIGIRNGIAVENTGTEYVEDQINSLPASGNGAAESPIYANFMIYTGSRHTIDALIDLGIIKNESELVLQKDYGASMQ